MYVSLYALAVHGEITYHQEGELIIETVVSSNTSFSELLNMKQCDV